MAGAWLCDSAFYGPTLTILNEAKHMRKTARTATRVTTTLVRMLSSSANVHGGLSSVHSPSPPLPSPGPRIFPIYETHVYIQTHARTRPANSEIRVRKVARTRDLVSRIVAGTSAASSRTTAPFIVARNTFGERRRYPVVVNERKKSRRGEKEREER